MLKKKLKTTVTEKIAYDYVEVEATRRISVLPLLSKYCQTLLCFNPGGIYSIPVLMHHETLL